MVVPSDAVPDSRDHDPLRRRVEPGDRPSPGEAPIAVYNEWLRPPDFGSQLACSVFDDPALTDLVRRNDAGDCPRDLPQGRIVTRVDARIASFVDTNGDRGAGWMILPSSDGANDGRISVLECRPSTAQISAAACDTIIADWIARNDTSG